jgi:hypothetical protein
MEDPDTFACECYGTLIRVTRGYRGAIYDEDGAVDIIVVGQREQQQLNSTICFDQTMGKVSKKRWNSVCIMKKESDSSSYEDRDNSTRSINHRDYNKKDMESYVLGVVEPRVINPCLGNRRENCSYKREHGEEAIEKALGDLPLCYKNVLTEGLQRLGKKKEKSIAIPALATTFCLPRKDAACVAVTTILDFIKDNPTAYNLIHLFVKKRFEFEWYKELLAEYVAYAVEQK